MGSDGPQYLAFKNSYNWTAILFVCHLRLEVSNHGVKITGSIDSHKSSTDFLRTRKILVICAFGVMDTIFHEKLYTLGSAYFESLKLRICFPC